MALVDPDVVAVDPAEAAKPPSSPAAGAASRTEARSRPLEVLVLAGGLSHERDVSLRSGRRVADALEDAGVSATVTDVDSDLLPTLDRLRPDVVWPLLHGSTGEDGSIRDLLELVGVPAVGTGSAGSRIAWSKPVSKTILARAGVATPESATLPASVFREVGARAVLDRVVDRLGLPLVVKPAKGGSALGVSVVTDVDALPQAMVTCFSYGEVALIERAAVGTELAVSVVDLGEGPVALPPVEIVVEDGIYDFDARYNAGRTEFYVPARVPAQHARAAQDAAVTAHRVLGLRGLSRTDLIVDDDGVPWFLEVNSAPGMTETSLLPLAAEAAGYALPDLYRAIVEHALRG
ncbi:MAG TPA: D-alanine--D-alanine ligase [Micrococcales bacterium]|uniref:D-alanine--D-alanine ligase family protein n=1 Tax=Miniimonas arenae TaxID=676201 RepID=UPI000EC59B07|nr:D-alanine--D-alanine ligase [Miniimonas arenae]HCX86089.1 D-alanine--D-alanine ligase [Micrococcales bacterium]